MTNPLTPKDFPAFFQALWGYAPFPWQTRLLERVRASGWPSTLDLPTGSGKTATLDIALFALALDAFEPPERRKQSRRIVLVVDRRVVVDQAYHRALDIALKLDRAKDGVLERAAAALRTLAGNPEALPVLPALLRGGMPRESDWAETPSQPTILLSTVDQVGSRLLFRGYGVSDRMKPLHAGLLGRDALYLLDEVHLARPFEETLRTIAQRYSSVDAALDPLPRSLVVVRMSATVAGQPDDDTFTIDERDRTHGLAARLGATKIAALKLVNTPRDDAKARDALAKAAVREVERFAKGSPRAIAVIVNRVSTARQVAVAARERLGPDWQVSLLTGRMRPLDRRDREVSLLDRIRAGRKRTADAQRVLLVSTQAVEVGADFDFDALVTECAPLDALRQRFGRLDRLGELQATSGVVLAASALVDEKAEPDSIYGEALAATWRWLHEVGEPAETEDTSVVDFGIDALGAKLIDAGSAIVANLAAPRAVAPVLSKSHVERWTQTSPEPMADPDVAPFLHGMGRTAPEVQLVWRADLAPSLLADASLPFVRDVLELVRPSAPEALSVPLWAATRWLCAVAQRSQAQTNDLPASPAISDVEGVGSEEPGEFTLMAPAVRWRGAETKIATSPEDLRPGDTLVVPTVYGGIDVVFASWDPDCTEAVVDRGDEAQLLQRGRAVLRLHKTVLSAWGSSLKDGLRQGPRVTDEDRQERGARAERDAFHEWRRAVQEDATVPAWVHVALGALGRRVELTNRAATDSVGAEADTEESWRAVWSDRRVPGRALRSLFGLPVLRENASVTPEAATEEDEGSFLGSEVSLHRHLVGVRDFAAAFAAALSLPKAIAEDVALAGWLHDLGKADRRFQLMLHGGDEVREAGASELLAKSSVPAADREARERARERAGYPKGTRHELMSVALIAGDESLESRAHDWDLVLHLVASHHGWCRPFAPLVGDHFPVQVEAELDGQRFSSSSDHGLTCADSGIADRFWRLQRRYSAWGLAWLEAILRLADHRESEREAGKDTGDV